MANKGMSKAGKIVATLFLLPLGIVIPVLSLESHYATPTSAQTPTASQEERIAKYKAALATEVKTSEQARIKLRCSVAQARGKTLATRLTSVQKKRAAAYDNIVKKLNEQITRLEDQAYETTSLKENTVVLSDKVVEFKANMDGYAQSISDLSTLNCNSDPVAFAAALETARKHHERLLSLVTDIRAYITNTIKPSLEQVKVQIESGRTTGGEQ